MPEKRELAAHRIAIARASRRAQQHPDDPAYAEALLRVQQAYYEAKLDDEIRAVVSKAPPLTAEAAERLAALLRPGGGSHAA
jgi:hypothetical protein